MISVVWFVFWRFFVKWVSWLVIINDNLMLWWLLRSVEYLCCVGFGWNCICELKSELIECLLLDLLMKFGGCLIFMVNWVILLSKWWGIVKFLIFFVMVVMLSELMCLLRCEFVNLFVVRKCGFVVCGSVVGLKC